MADDNPTTFESYREFWLFYLSQHSKRETKMVHLIGLLIGIGVGLVGAITRVWWMIPASVILAYGMLWSSHFMIEKNVPATLRWPVWSLISEFRLAYRMLRGDF